MTIDIYERRTLTDDFEAVLAFNETRGLGQNIIGRTGILQHGAADIGLDALAREFGFGHNGRGDGALQHGSILQKCDYHPVHGSEILSLVAQHGYHHYSVFLVGDDIEGAVLFSDGAAKHRGVGSGEHSDIGICHGLALLVNHSTLPILLCAGSHSGKDHHCNNKYLFHIFAV